MNKLICVIGKSSCGKDTIIDEILNNPRIKDLQKIVRYTTRPKRVDEHDGTDYYFIDNDSLLNMIIPHEHQCNHVIELSEFTVASGDTWKYATIINDNIVNDYNNYIMSCHIDACLEAIKYLGIDNVIPIYIDIDDKIRLMRAISREEKQSNPNYIEMCRRYVADTMEYSESALDKIPNLARYSNNDMVNSSGISCTDKIVEDILMIKNNTFGVELS